MSVSRRTFLKTSGAAGFALSFRLSPSATAVQQSSPLDPTIFVRIDPDETITVHVARLEMGQGVRTLLPMLLVEELDGDWARVRIAQAEPGGRFKGVRLHTSGSSSGADMYGTMRRAGASMRSMLVAAAAARWQVEPGTCRTSAGSVTHPPSGRRLTYGALSSAAASQSVPDEPVLKDPATFTLIGAPVKRVDGPDIVTGRATYGFDVRVPGMLFATIEHAPTLGATVGRIDADAARRVPGVRHVVPVSSGIQAGVAVVADDSWAALRGREALRVEWTPGPHANFDSDVYLSSLSDRLGRSPFKVRADGDARRALETSARRVSATYQFPFQAHAPLETMNCTAHVRAKDVDVWAPTQTDVRSIAQAARVSGLPPEAVRLHPQMMGGGFGRRLFSDYVGEAVEVSKAVSRPIHVFWTRPDDMRSGYFQPATIERMTAGLDQRGALTALFHETTASDLTIYDIHDGRNIWTGPPKPPRKPTSYEEDAAPWGAYDNPYEWPNLLVECTDITSPVPVGPWRAVGYPSTVFGRESFLDEIAHAISEDPIALRLSLLPAGTRTIGPYVVDRRRLARVLETVRDRAEWARPRAAGPRPRALGVAVNVYHAGSYIAMIADVSAEPDGTAIRVHRIVTAIDCGRALNPLGVRGQAESAISWGLSAALFGRIDFRAGAVVQSSFADFRVLRINEMPEIDTVIVDSGARPGGFGEHVVPLVAPAVANATFAATGARIRTLPLL